MRFGVGIKGQLRVVSWGGGRTPSIHPRDGSGCREEAPDGGHLAFVAFKIIFRDQKFLFSQFFFFFLEEAVGVEGRGSALEGCVRSVRRK